MAEAFAFVDGSPNDDRLCAGRYDNCRIQILETTCLCETCGRSLCVNCARDHVHHVVELCRLHGQRLEGFCRTCNRVVCSICHRDVPNVHRDVSNDVELRGLHGQSLEGFYCTCKRVVCSICHRDVPNGHRDVPNVHALTSFEEEVSLLKEQFNGLRLRLRDAKERAAHLHDLVGEVHVGEVHEVVEAQIRNVEERANNVNNGRNEERRAEYRNHLENDRERCEQQVNELMAAATEETAKIQDYIVRLDRPIMTGDVHCLNSLCVARTVLRDQVNSIEQSLSDITDTIARFVPADEDAELGHLERRRFTNLQFKTELFFPEDQQCAHIISVRKVANGGVAVLGRSAAGEQDENPDSGDSVLYLWDRSQRCRSVRNGVHPAHDISATNNGIMVLRGEEPHIRIYNATSTAIMDEMTFEQSDIDGTPRYISTDSRGTIFVCCGADDSRKVVALKETEGKAIYRSICTAEVQPGTTRAMSFCPRAMSFCPVSQVLYVAAGNRVVRYRWDGSTFAELPTPQTWIDEYFCWEVCKSPTGEIFTVGWMQTEKRNIKICQLIEESPGKFSLHEILFIDDEDIHGDTPHICVQGRRLVLAYGCRVQVFELLKE